MECDMEFAEYPKWKYHAKKDAVVVSDAKEEAALGKGWADSPAAFDKTETEAD